MATCRSDDLARQLRSLFELGVVAGLSDGQLLDRFNAGGSHAESAFSALVERHGPMVLRVCRAVLADPHDVDDAFQATFLVLVRKARSIRRQASCASWLHGVALRAAADIRSSAARRTRHERRAGEQMPECQDTTDRVALDELRRVLDEELGRLREAYRSPLVLCYLEGRTCEEAAQQLGWPLGTVKSRLARGRERLRGRLLRRGVAPAVGVMGLPDLTRAAVPPSLVRRVVEAVVQGVGWPSAVAAVVGSELRRGVMTRLGKVAAVALAGMGFVAGAAGYVAASKREGGAGQAEAVPPKQPAGAVHARVVDWDGKPLAGVTVEAFGLPARPLQVARADDQGRVVFQREEVGHVGTLVARVGESLGFVSFFDERDITPRQRPPSTTADDPLVLRLRPRSHIVTGLVTDTALQPVAGVRVVVIDLNAPDQFTLVNTSTLRQNGWFFGSATTSGDGRFALSLPRGVGAEMTIDDPRFAGGFAGVNEAFREASDLVVVPGGGVTGHVIGADGAPVAGARIFAQSIEMNSRSVRSWQEAVSGPDGRFSLEGLEPGVHNILVLNVAGRERATARAAEALRVRAGEDTKVDLRVIEGRPLQGVVVDSRSDQPIPGIEVGCYGPARPRSGAAVQSTKTDDQGRFTFHVPPGAQFVYLGDGTSLGPLSRAKPVVPENGEVEPVRLVWVSQPATSDPVLMKKATIKPPEKVEKAPTRKAPELRTVTGHVRDPQGRPVVSGSVTLDQSRFKSDQEPDPSGPGPPSATVDRDGVYVLRDIPRGEAPVVVAAQVDRSTTPYFQTTIPANRETFDIEFKTAVRPRPAPAKDEPVPRELKDRLTFVDLAPRGTDLLAEGPGSSGNDLARLPRGVHKLGDTYFRIGEKMVHVAGRFAPGMPETVPGLSVGARADRVHFLHACQQAGNPPGDKVLGAYIVRYADGSSAQVPIVLGRNIDNWWNFATSLTAPPSDARIAWEGSNDSTDLQLGLKIRLFETTWTNPHPDRVIATIDATSNQAECDPFLVGLTLERH